MFLDASAVVAILNEESEAVRLLAKIDAAKTHFITSPMAQWETVAALSRARKAQIMDVLEIVKEFHKTLNSIQANITPEMGVTALKAFEKYGKGTNHKAQLNMGECFSYAVAKSYRVPLLYVGNDFAHTDLG